MDPAQALVRIQLHLAKHDWMDHVNEVAGGAQSTVKPPPSRWGRIRDEGQGAPPFYAEAAVPVVHYMPIVAAPDSDT